MASLRDQLVSKGLASKKQARKAKRSLKEERKRAQGGRAKASQIAKQQAEAEAKERAAREAQRQADRAAHAESQGAVEHANRVRQIIQAHRLGGRGPVAFHVPHPDGRRLVRLQLPVGLVRDLRGGRAAVASYPDGQRSWRWEVVSPAAVDKLRAIAPESLLFDATTRGALEDPAQAPLHRTWETDLRPHRVRDPAELARWRARES